MQQNKLKNVLEAILLSADRPLKLNQLAALFEEDKDRPTNDELRKALLEFGEDCESRGYELKDVASGYRIQVKQEYAPWVSRLWDEKPARYTRALLETMSLIAYRQPVTRGEIEDVRGVSVSSNIIRTMLERNWIRVLGHKDVPGKPELFGTTKEFLDYFNLKSLDDLPSLAEIKDLDKVYPELALDDAIVDETKADENSDGTVNEAATDQVGDNEYVDEPHDERLEAEEAESTSAAAGN